MIDEKISALVAALPPAPHPWRLCRAPMLRRHADVYCLSAQGAGYRVGIKCFAHVKYAQEYFSQMTQKYAQKTPSFAVPQPYGVDLKNNAVSMRWAEGISLSAALLKWHTSPKQRKKLVTQSGAWLAWFHTSDHTKTKQGDPDIFLKGIKKLAEKIEKKKDLPTFFKSSMDALTRHAHHISNTSIFYGRPHGDFMPHNLLVAGETFTGIDFHTDSDLPLITDICRMATYLGIYRYWATPSKAQQDYRDLIAGYSNKALPDEQTMTWLMLAEATRWWASLYVRQIDRKRWGRGLKCYRLRADIIRLTKALDKTV